MARITFLWGVFFLAVPVFAHAKDYPLEFKTLSASEAKGYDWSYGAIKMIVATRPVGLKNEPASMSPHPLYGNFEWPSDTTSLLFRLDESQGEGKGYDCLILDLNHNGDLTDDAAIFPAANFERRSAFEGQESTLFGPIKAPASKSIGISEPIYYAVLDVRRDALMKLRDRQKTANAGYLGNLRLKAAWCLETTVELGGIKHRIALIDNDANMRLGVLRKARPSDGGWFLRAAEGDRLLLAKGESGAYGFPLPFAPILYLGATPCMATLAADCRSIQIEPWPEPLAEVSLQPHGEQVRGLGLVWESSKDQWQFIELGIEHGKLKVPPGKYGLWAISVSAASPNAEAITASGTSMNGKKVISAMLGKANILRCGAPLEIKVTTSASSSAELQIHAEVVGAGGETYSSFDLGQKTGKRKVLNPTFTITAAGKQVAVGTLEFG